MNKYEAREDRHHPGIWELLIKGFNMDTVIATYGSEQVAREMADRLAAASIHEVKL